MNPAAGDTDRSLKREEADKSPFVSSLILGFARVNVVGRPSIARAAGGRGLQTEAPLGRKQG